MHDPHSPLKVPPLSRKAIEQSADMTRFLRREIERDGPMGFDRFMAMTLYAPGLGYYSSGQAMIGPEGDFITAPEISPLFGRCIARQCAEVFENLGGGGIFEIGAGSGILAQQIMHELAALDRLPEHYYIFEISPAMRERQEARFKAECTDFYHLFKWIPQPPSKDWQGVILANEVVDCLPLKRFRYGPEGIIELRVKNYGRGFAWLRQPAPSDFADRVRGLLRKLPHELPAGYQSEINMDMARWLDTVSYAMRRGVMLVIDYGYPRHEYYHPERTDGTLVCHYRHRAHDDPFLFVALQDITSFVDFTTLAELADVEAHLETVGYTTQGAFLLNSGIEELLAESAADDRRRVQLRAGVQRLVDPADMGERFKVIAMAKDYADFATPSGFSPLDMREKLAPAF